MTAIAIYVLSLPLGLLAICGGLALIKGIEGLAAAMRRARP